MKRYAQRDTEALGQRYIDNLEAMTAEGLHDKAAIAAELAVRDTVIAEYHRDYAALAAERDAARAEVERLREAIARALTLAAVAAGGENGKL